MTNLTSAFITNRTPDEIKAIANEMPLAELAATFGALDPRARVTIFRMLEKRKALELFEYLEAHDQAELISAIGDPESAQLLGQLEPDDRARLIEELPAKVAKRLLATLSPEARAAVSELLGYPEGSVGRIMTPNYLAVRENVTVADALAALRASPLREDETDVIFVIDAKRRYRGFVRLSRLIKEAPDRPVSSLLTETGFFVRATAPQLEAARLLKLSDLPAIPVVDSEERLVGAVTFDDVIDLIERDTSETMYLKAGVGDLVRRKDEVYSRKLTQGSILYPIRVRIAFLFVTLLGGLAVGGLIDQFEGVLASVLAAAVFIPLVMDMGGNVGTQSTTIFARGLALGHINLKRFGRHLAREVSIGALMGVILGLIGGTVAYFWQGIPNGIPQIGIAVGVSLAVVVTLATFLGFVLPWIMLKLGLDHAPGADPFITTIKDFTGLALYFYLVSILVGVE